MEVGFRDTRETQSGTRSPMDRIVVSEFQRRNAPFQQKRLREALEERSCQMKGIPSVVYDAKSGNGEPAERRASETLGLEQGMRLMLMESC